MTEAAKRFVPLSKTAHATLRWRPFTDWHFAAGDIIVPLVAAELARAAGNFPVVFTRAGDRVEAAALLGLRPGENAFVTARGEWAAEYAPAALRGRPFVLGVAGEGRSLLCIDEASPMLVRDGQQGHAVFGEGGELTPEVRKAAEFLRSLQAGVAATWRATEALVRHNCLEPLRFAPSLQTPLKQAEGLMQANEAALQALAPEALAELMSLGALAVAYTQLVSLGKMGTLARLAEARARQAAPAAPATQAPDLSVLDRDGTLSFGSLG